jgi:hypothetical protein
MSVTKSHLITAAGIAATVVVLSVTTPLRSIADKPAEVQVVAPLPLPVRAVPSGQLVQISSKCDIDPVSVACEPATAPYIVPAGKRLVINYFSLRAHLPAGQAVSALIGDPAGFPLNVGNYLPLSPVAPGPNSGNIQNGSFTATGAPMNLMIDAGTAVGVRCARTSTLGSAACRFAVNGFLEDLI